MDKTKTIILDEFHSLEALKVDDFELPEFEETMIEVQVAYCGLNFADMYTIHELSGALLPFALGIEASGIATRIGSETDGLIKEGDKVIVYDYKGGLQRQTTRTSYNKCYKIPESLDLESAAAVFVNYLTAWYSLFQIGNMGFTQNLFISSCAGGVGLAAITIANRLLKEVNVFGTASESKKQFLQSLGVNFVHYDELADLDEKFHVVIESQSTEARNILIKKLHPFGKLIIIGAKDLVTGPASSADPNINPVDLIFGNCVVGGLHLGMLTDNYPEMVRETLNLIFNCLQLGERGNKPVVKVFDFDDAKSAYKEMAERKNIGKILLRL